MSKPKAKPGYPEPAVPVGKRVTTWIRWTDWCAAAHIFGLSNYSQADNFRIKGILDAAIARGILQVWKLGPHQQSPAYYRNVY